MAPALGLTDELWAGEVEGCWGSPHLPAWGRVDHHASDTLTQVSFAYALSKQTLCGLHAAHWKLPAVDPAHSHSKLIS